MRRRASFRSTSNPNWKARGGQSTNQERGLRRNTFVTPARVIQALLRWQRSGPAPPAPSLDTSRVMSLRTYTLLVIAPAAPVTAMQ